MKLFRSTATALALTTGLLALPVHAQQNASGDPLYTSEAPAAFSMVADLREILGFYRPFIPKKPEYGFYGD